MVEGRMGLKSLKGSETRKRAYQGDEPQELEVTGGQFENG